MTIDRRASANSQPVDLTREADFSVGAATVRPSLSEVTGGGRSVRLQTRVMQVLVVLARARGEVVSREELILSCWGGLALGDDVINRCIGRLRRLAEAEAEGAFAIETLPRIGYRLTALGPAAETLKPARPRRAIWRFGLGGLAGAAIMAGLWTVTRPGPTPQNQGVAVLPFDAAPGDPALQSFADGVAYEVASALANADLKTLSSERVRGLSRSERDAAAVRLNAAFALSGRVQRTGEMLNLTVALGAPRQHEVLWSQDFKRPQAQAQAMQEQVAAKIADVMRCALSTEKFRGRRLDLETIKLYLRSCDLQHQPEASDQVRDLLKKVAQREPDFPYAWSDLAVASEMAADALPPAEAAIALKEGDAAARRALKLNPNEGQALMALADMVHEPGHWAARNELLLQGLAVEPDNPDIENREAEFLQDVGRTKEALAFAARSAKLDPLSPIKALVLAGALGHAGRIAEARAIFERAVQIWPEDPDILAGRIVFEARVGDPDRALSLLNDPTQRPARWDVAALEDNRRFARLRQHPNPAETAAYASHLLQDLHAGRSAVTPTVIRLSALGADTAAFLAAGQQTDADPLSAEALFRSPAAGMRRDPRFMALAGKMGLVDYWRRTGKWPDFCETPERPYDCRAVAARLR